MDRKLSTGPGQSAGHPASDERAFISRIDVAEMFGVSVSTVTRWAMKGLLPAIRTPGGHYRFPADAIHETVTLSLHSSKKEAGK